MTGINELLMATSTHKRRMLALMNLPTGVPRVLWKMFYCADGFSMAVIAGKGLHCEPDSEIGPWIKVRVIRPSEDEPLLRPFKWTYRFYEAGDTNVHCYVPVEVIKQIIDKHGGRIDG